MLATAVVLVLLGTVAYAAVLPTRDDAAKQLAQRSGRIRIKNSLGGKPSSACWEWCRASASAEP